MGPYKDKSGHYRQIMGSHKNIKLCQVLGVNHFVRESSKNSGTWASQAAFLRLLVLEDGLSSL